MNFVTVGNKENTIHITLYKTYNVSMSKKYSS